MKSAHQSVKKDGRSFLQGPIETLELLLYTFDMKLLHKFFISVMSLLILVISGIGVMTVLSEKKLLEKELNKRFNEITLQLAKVSEESLYQSDLVLFNYLKSLASERAFVEAYFEDNNGLVRVHSKTEMIGSKNNSRDILDSELNFPTKSVVFDGSNKVMWIYKTPVKFGQTMAGWAVCSFDKSQVDQFIKTSLLANMRNWIHIGLFSFVLAFLGSILLAQTLTKPIQDIVAQVKEVGDGRRVPFSENPRQDELGLIPQELNKTIHKLKELDQMKSEFVSAVTHELRSPLTAIERFVSLLLKGNYGPLTNDQKESLITVKNNSIRLAQFIDDVLTSSKLDSRKIDCYLENINIYDVAKEVYELFLPISREKKLKMVLEAQNEHVLVRADRMMTHHILSNLVSNALKFTEKGGVNIGFSINKKRLNMHVTDSGVGISSNDKKQIFEKFYRSLHTSKSTKGTGLGLYIVKSFAEAQNATIEVQDNPQGPGTQMVLSLPLAENNENI